VKVSNIQMVRVAGEGDGQRHTMLIANDEVTFKSRGSILLSTDTSDPACVPVILATVERDGREAEFARLALPITGSRGANNTTHHFILTDGEKVWHKLLTATQWQFSICDVEVTTEMRKLICQALQNHEW
jgi:hypothetical protein